MKNVVASLLCVLALFVALAPCFADTANGVLAEERVVNLPKDQDKWYVSVVGDTRDASYRRVLEWFKTDPNLMKLRAQVHFCVVQKGTAIFNERYASNIKGLPTVRMQLPNGKVVYEAAGKNLPMTPAGLYGAIADAAQTAQGCRPLLPWRRGIDNRCRPNPNPEPTPEPLPEPDPMPEPPIDDGGAPIFDEPEPAPAEPAANPYLWLPLALLGGGVVGLTMGYGKKLYQHVHPAVR